MTGRNSLAVRVGRLAQALPLSWLRPLEARYFHSGDAGNGQPRLLILLALPRSGSTLAYQCLIHGLELLYLSNLWNVLYSLPGFGGQLSKSVCGKHRSEFQSNQGFVPGACGPAEGLRFWSYWTGHGLNEATDTPVTGAVLERRVRYLGSVLSHLGTRETPFLAGFLGHTLVSEQLKNWFPDAVFVRVHRDPLSNALSLLRCRQNGGEDWFSVFPRECQALVNADIHTQVAGQVYWLNRRLNDAQLEERTIEISYENLCRAPNAELERVALGCKNFDMALSVKNRLPSSFEFSCVTPEDGQDAALLAAALTRLQSEHGPLVSRAH